MLVIILTASARLDAQQSSVRVPAKFSGFFEQRLLDRSNTIVVAKPVSQESDAAAFGLVRIKVVDNVRVAGDAVKEYLVRGIPPKFDRSSAREHIFFLRRDDLSRFAELIDVVSLPEGDRSARLSYLKEMVRIAAVVGNDRKIADLRGYCIDSLQSTSSWVVSNSIREMERLVALAPGDFAIESINRLVVESTVPTFADDLIRLSKCRERVAENFGLGWVLRSNGLGEKERRALINDVVAAHRSVRDGEVRALLDDIAQTFAVEATPLFAALIERGPVILARHAVAVVAAQKLRGTTKALAELARRPTTDPELAADAVRAIGRVGDPDVYDSLRLLAQHARLEPSVHEAMWRIGSNEMRLFLADRLRELERSGRGTDPATLNLRRYVDDGRRARSDSVTSRPTSAPTSRPMSSEDVNLDRDRRRDNGTPVRPENR